LGLRESERERERELSITDHWDKTYQGDEEMYVMIGYCHVDQGGDKTVREMIYIPILQLKADSEIVFIWIFGRL
jgi:hypothetical protein